MIKLRQLKFKDHPILGDLCVDFCKNNKAVDTIIIAGENGSGKSTLLNEIYNLDFKNIKGIINKEKSNFIDYIEYEQDATIVKLNFSFNENGNFMIKFPSGKSVHYLDEKENTFKINFIYSDVDINYNINKITSSTNLDVDKNKNSEKSNNQTAQEITQLFIDIENLDNGDHKRIYDEYKRCQKDTNKINIPLRMDRFKKAFNFMFEDIKWYGLKNENGIQVYFQNKVGLVPIDRLSSGEKQIVFRSGYLLKDSEALKGALVLIDEPEISMHPNWQKKILDFYKIMFADSAGKQTSQIFVVTHSPFIIHNENRYNDKVIIMCKDENGKIKIKDKPEYYEAKNISLVEDAFNINEFNNEPLSTVYLEGRTDEKYFVKALEVFDLNPVWRFKWVGYIDQQGQERNTGKESLNKAKDFLIAQKYDFKNICLFDSDTNKSLECREKVISYAIKSFNSTKNMNKGIENTLILDNVDIEKFYSTNLKEDDYGGFVQIKTLNKMALCDYICSLPKQELKTIFGNLKSEIDRISEFLKD